jgi:putative addiction module killer protein
LRLVQSRRIRAYITRSGLTPYRLWLNSLKDIQTRERIQARVLRIEFGNFGDYHSVGEGVYELRLSFGAGYRIYFGLDGDVLILLLLGGDKSSQKRDIQKAKIFWREYLEDK